MTSCAPAVALLAAIFLAAAPAMAGPTLASRIGSTCTVAKNLPFGITADDALEAVRSAEHRDAANVFALVRAGRITGIPENVTARVLDSDWTKDALKVCILSGPALGRELWIFHGFCT